MTTTTHTSDRVWLSPPEIAELLGLSHAKILNWITTGELRAANVATRHGGRPRYKTSRADLESFLARRSTTPEPKPRRRRKRETDNVINFYEE